MKYKALIIPIAIILIGLYFCVYTIDERRQVVITQFGRPIGDPITEPGRRGKLVITALEPLIDFILDFLQN